MSFCDLLAARHDRHDVLAEGEAQILHVCGFSGSVSATWSAVRRSLDREGAAEAGHARRDELEQCPACGSNALRS